MKKWKSNTFSLNTMQWKKDPLRTATTIYMALPLLVFYCGFLRWYLAAICSVGLVAVVYWSIRKQSLACSEDIKKSFSRKTIVLVFLFTMLWSYLGGMNGFFYQTSDWDCRNAIYFDLIQYPWPVVYPKSGGALVYYIGHWLPPAILAKAVLSITGSTEAGLFAGRMLLWLWSGVGLTIVILLLFRLLKADSGKKTTAVLLLFVFFSGLDIIGAVCEQKTDFLLHPQILHLEWWGGRYQYSSITTCLFWVFNQSIIPWIATACFLLDDNPGNYMFCCVSCLLSGPLACVGLVVLMFIRAIVFLLRKIKEKEVRVALSSIFSVSNLVAFLLLFPPVALFILSNNAIGGSSASYGGAAGSNAPLGAYLNAYLGVPLFEFLLLDVGLYMIFIAPDCRKDPIYYTIAISFLVIPYFHVGTSNDFCMRASIPALFVLMFYVSRFLIHHFKLTSRKAFIVKNEKQKVFRICAWMLAICFLIGTVTPVVEIYRGFYNVAKQKTIFLEDQSIMTFNGETVPYNFGCDNPDQHAFFRYFAKK